MTFVRTLTAHCDHTENHLGHAVKTCSVTQEINPNIMQSFHALLDLGWAVDAMREENGQLLLFCPDHKDEAISR